MLARTPPAKKSAVNHEKFSGGGFRADERGGNGLSATDGEER
jgi:hypothetical protein